MIADAISLLQQAVIRHQDGDYDAAEKLYRRVLLDDPANPDALHMLGVIARESRSYDLAEKLIARSSAIAPVSGKYRNLAIVRSTRGDIEGAIWAYRQALALEPTFLEARDGLIFALDLHPWVSWQVKLEARKVFDERHCKALTLNAPPHTNGRDPERKLRIGYVGADFKRHSAMAAFAPVVLNHNRKQFDVLLYSTAESHDEASDAFREDADVWMEVYGASAAELAEIIRKDKIDILVDLSGYSAGNVLEMFAHKPAPIQVTGWGYATGTGLTCMDYLIADAVTVPPEHEERYTEQIIRLPCLLAHEPLGDTPPLGPPPVERNGYITYGYLGRPVKLNDRVLSAWAEVLRRVPRSRLLLKGGEYRDDRLRGRILGLLAAFDVAPERVELRYETVRYTHIETYNEIDVALDPFPHGGGATTFDACLMGVPTITLLGDTVSGRTGASILANVGDMAGYAASSPEDYIEAAMLGVGALTPRHQLRSATERSIMFDGPGYCKLVERRYRAIWRAWCAAQWRQSA